MLKFVSAYLALSYLAFATLVVLGLLQVLAARQSLVGLALVDYRRPGAWRRALGPALIALAYVWFFGTRREILTPGPAGAELVVLFGGGVLLALALTLLGASLVRPHRRARAPATLPSGVEAREVRLDHGAAGMVFRRADGESPGPAVCLLPDPMTPPTGLHAAAGSLAAEGLVVLVPAWEPALQVHPDALLLVPSAMAFLCREPSVDSGRLAVGGVNLGGDLALRAAAADRQVRAAFALAPLLAVEHLRAGLGLLAEMTCAEALRWRMGGRRGRLAAALDAASAVEQLHPRPVLVAYGSEEAIVPQSQVRPRLEGAGQVVQIEVVPGEGHLSLATSERAWSIVGRWLARVLGAG